MQCVTYLQRKLLQQLAKCRRRGRPAVHGRDGCMASTQSDGVPLAARSLRAGPARWLAGVRLTTTTPSCCWPSTPSRCRTCCAGSPSPTSPSGPRCCRVSPGPQPSPPPALPARVMNVWVAHRAVRLGLDSSASCRLGWQCGRPAPSSPSPPRRPCSRRSCAARPRLAPAPAGPVPQAAAAGLFLRGELDNRAEDLLSAANTLYHDLKVGWGGVQALPG